MAGGSERERHPTPAPRTAPSSRRSAAGPAGSVLALQRMAGNSATAQLVQTKKGGAKKPPKETKPVKKYFELSETQLGWDPPKCIGWAGDAKNGGRYLEAAAFYKRAYELRKNQGRDLAHYTAQMFRQIKGYEDDYKYWMDVANGVVKHPLLPEFQHA